VDTVVLPAGWERHAATTATLFDPLGPSLAWWGTAALLLVAAVGLSERRPRLSLALALCATPILAISANGLLDDAYIQFRYAANLAGGLGPVFNAGERIEGASGGAWIGAIAVVSAVSGRDAAVCGRLLSVAAACLSSFAAAAFGGALAGPRGAARAAILWAAVPTTALYAATGLEASAFALALWLIAASVVRDRCGPAAAAGGALAASLRPEGAVLLAGAALLWRYLGRSGRAALIGAAAGTVIMAASRLAFYGLPVPRSAIVKGVTASAGLDAGLRYLARVAFEWWPLAPALLFDRSRKLTVPILAAAPWVALVVLRGGDWMPGGRYFLPVLVILVAGAAIVPSSRTASWILVGSLIWSLLLMMPLPESGDFSRRLPAGWAWRSMAEHRAQARWWEALGVWVRASAPADAYLASGPSGALPYGARLRTFDMYGLCSPVKQESGWEAGHRLWGLREAVEAGADWIYPGRELLLVRSPDAVLPAADVRSSDPLADYTPVTIVHAPEYRLDFLRDTIWVRREHLPTAPAPAAVPRGR
jgi:arabinofuranosyltransferase